jgi:amino acid transporter
LAILTLAGPFLGKKMLVPLTNVSALAFIFSCMMVSFACMKMRKTEPDLPRPYKVPGGKFGIALACIAGAIIVLLMILPFSPAALNSVEWSIVIGWLLIGMILMYISNKKGNKSQAA